MGTNFIIVSNSPVTVLSSNASGYAISYSTSMTPGPLFWPAIAAVALAIIFAVWLGTRKRGR